MNRFQLCIVTICLSVGGLVFFLYKVFVLEFPVVPERKALIWRIEAHVAFNKKSKGPVSVSMFIPSITRRFVVLNENFISRGYALQTTTQGPNRKATWSKKNVEGPQSLYYRVLVRRVEWKETTTLLLTPEIEKPDFKGSSHEAAESLISDARQTSAELGRFIVEIVKSVNQPNPDDRIRLLLGEEASPRKKINLIVQLLAHAGIPARAVQGVRLHGYTRQARIEHWLEVFSKKKWQFFNPITGATGIPDDFLIWWRGKDILTSVEGIERPKVNITVLLDLEEAIRVAMARKHSEKSFFLKLSLFALPVQAQAVYRILLLVPIGAFLVVILRNVVGLKTFGTFMPMLIALAFRETELLWGIVLFTLLVLIGLAIRLYLEHLKLLVVPRLAAVLTVVVLMMLALSLLTHALGLERGLSVALFPMVILTMTIERMSIIWEELGPREAMQQGLGSLIAAVIAYLIMNINPIEYLVFVFPELLLILLAGIILLGRYSGYRLMELRRFKELIKTDSDV